MRVAAIYDIHGNLPALEAVLDAIRDEHVDSIIVGGDVVPGPMPAESIQALLDLSTPVQFIRGNGENDILTLHRGGELARVPKQFHEVMQWVLDTLPPEHLDAFDSWPRTLRVTIPGLGDVLFCHATPRDDNEIFTRITPDDRLQPIFDTANADVVMCGHTHMQFARTIGNTRVVNAGSVGMPFGEPGAYWALLSSDGIELRCTPYDFAAAAQRIHATAFPEAGRFDVQRPRSEAEMIKIFEAAALRQP